MDHNALRCAWAPGRVRIISAVLAVRPGPGCGSRRVVRAARPRTPTSGSRSGPPPPASPPSSRSGWTTSTAPTSTSYIKGINELLTTKAKTKNQKTFERIKQSYEAAKVKGTGKVLLTAVGDSDDDSATVLVVHDASVKTTQGNIDHHYRWSVDVVKVNGEWRVDDFNPVN